MTRILSELPPSSGVGQPTIGRPFYVQAKGQLWPTRAFYAEYAQYTPVVNHLSINTNRREVCFRYQAPA